MIALRESQFEFAGIVFGPGVPVKVEGFRPGAASVRNQDFESQMIDARAFGVDRRTPATWGWDLGVDRRTAPDGLDSLAELSAAWHEADDSPGAVRAVRYRLGGRTRLVYGRPRRFEYSADDVSQGYVPVVCDFDRADLLHYADEESAHPLTLAASPSGGYRAPFRVPLRAVGGTQRLDEVTVGGSARTWAVVDFTGAATNPWVEVAGWRVQLNRTLAFDQTVTVDSRPWAQCAYLPDGTPVPGWLTPSTRLTAMRLPPGTHQAAFGCDASTGPVSATIRWRDASLSL